MDQTPPRPNAGEADFPALPKIGPGGPPALQPPPDRWIAVPRALLAAPISDFARTVYLWLLDHAGSRGTAWPGVTTLARETRHSERQVRRALAELRDAELLSCHHRGLGQTNVYELRALAPVGDRAPDRSRPVIPDRSRPVIPDRSRPVMQDRYGPDTQDRLIRTKEQEQKNTHTASLADEATGPAAPGGVCAVADAPEGNAPPSPGLVAARLNDAGLSKAVTRRLVEKFGAVACQQQLDWLPLRKARERAATLRRAIEESWLPPDGNPKIRLPGEKPPAPLPPPPPLPEVGPESDVARERVKALLKEKGLAGKLAQIGGAR